MSKPTPAHIAFLSVAILFTSTTSLAQAPHNLQGKVVLPRNAPPPNPVKVTLTFNGRLVHQTFTDLSGRFYFGGLARGRYQLIAEGDGQTFDTTRAEAEITALGNAPVTFTQNIQLRFKAGKTVPATGVTSVEISDPSLPARAREEYEKGIKDADNNRPENAVKHFQQAIVSHPQFYSAHVAIAEQYLKLKRDDEATDNYRKAIEMKPDRAAAYVGLGVMLVKQRKYDEAIPALRRSLEIEKHSSTPYLFLGLSEMMTGDYQSSESNLLRAYEIGKPPLAHLYLANLYESIGEPAKAIERLKVFLKENPNLPDERQRDVREAMDKLRKRVPKPQ